MSSLSSYIISNATLFRNPNGTEQEWTQTAHRKFYNPAKMIASEAAYLFCIPFSIVETALSSIYFVFAFLTFCRSPTGAYAIGQAGGWMVSSAFSIIWSATDSIINPFCNDMITTEKVAIACAASGNVFRVPVEAL
jgi:hypothetical protein